MTGLEEDGVEGSADNAADLIVEWQFCFTLACLGSEEYILD